MKKMIMLILSLTIVLAGCSESAVKKTVDIFLSKNENLSLTDNAYVTDDVSQMYNDKKDALLNDIFQSLGINEKQEVKLKDIDGYNTLAKKLIELKSHTKYTINNIDLNESKSKASVDLSVEYVDAGELIVKSISDSLDRSMLRSHNGEGINEEEFLTVIFESLNNSLINLDVNEDLIIKENVKVDLISKDNKWLISGIDDNTLNSFSLNFLKHKENTLNDKLKEVEANRLFLEIESKLHASFKETKRLLDEGLVTYDNLNKDGKLVQSLSKLNIKSEVVEKAGNENGVYYITKDADNNNITITVLNDDEKYTFTEK